MEIILLEKISKLGDPGDLVIVKPGYARNFLIPTGKAIRANEENKAEYEQRKVSLEKAELERKSSAVELADKLKSLKISIPVPVSEEGTLYGSIGTREMMDEAKDTMVWQVMGTGLDHVDLEYMKSRGFTITHCPGTFSAVAMAEAAIAFMLMISRQFKKATEVFNQSCVNRPLGENLAGKVLGVVGFGASAQALAVRAQAFDMRIFAVDVRT